jgi:hypothetical protein
MADPIAADVAGIDIDERKVPETGTIAVSHIVEEFSGDAPHALSEYYRGGKYVPRNAWGNMPSSGSIAISEFRGAVKEFRAEIGGDHSNFPDLRAIFNGWIFDPGNTPLRFRFINWGRIGATSPDRHVIYFGQFPAGSTITFENRGQILGSGGRNNGGSGGGAVYGIYNNQEMIFENYGLVYAGGGGGGKGGQGGQGYYDNCYTVTQSLGQGAGASTNYWPNPCLKSCQAIAADAFCQSNCPGACCTGPGRNLAEEEAFDLGPEPRWVAACYDCVRRYTQCDRYYTSGGGGGNGGRGIGWDNSDAGAGRTGGGVPDINAGYGGAGGFGGDWGAWGQTGNSGAGGNWSGGAGGASGGSPGAYLSAGGRVNFLNYGQVRGRVE